MNARAKAQQIEMINTLQQVILTAFGTSREGEYDYNTLERIEEILMVMLTDHLPVERRRRANSEAAYARYEAARDDSDQEALDQMTADMGELNRKLQGGK